MIEADDPTTSRLFIFACSMWSEGNKESRSGKRLADALAGIDKEKSLFPPEPINKQRRARPAIGHGGIVQRSFRFSLRASTEQCNYRACYLLFFRMLLFPAHLHSLARETQTPTMGYKTAAAAAAVEAQQQNPEQQKVFHSTEVF